jgi:hypothetical protein
VGGFGHLRPRFGRLLIAFRRLCRGFGRFFGRPAGGRATAASGASPLSEWARAAEGAPLPEGARAPLEEGGGLLLGAHKGGGFRDRWRGEDGLGGALEGGVVGDEDEGLPSVRYLQVRGLIVSDK